LGRIPPLWVLSSDSRGDLAEALARDEAAARAEWLAEWRRDVDAFVAREVLDACIVPKRQDLPREGDHLSRLRRTLHAAR